MRALDQMMRFVDDHQRRAAVFVREAIGVEVHELRRGADDIPRARFERIHQRRTFARVDRAVGAQNAHAERLEPAHQRLVLIVGQRAQWIEHDGLRAALERTGRRRQLKAQRLAAARAHHGERVLAGGNPFDHGALRIAQRTVAEQRALHVGRQRAHAGLRRRDRCALARDPDVHADAARAAAGDMANLGAIAFARIDIRRNARRDRLAYESEL